MIQPSGRKLLLLTIGAVTAVVIVVTVIVSFVAYHKVRVTMLDQVYRDSITVVEYLRTCALEDPGESRGTRLEQRKPLDYVKYHLNELSKEHAGYIQVVDRKGRILADSRQHVGKPVASCTDTNILLRNHSSPVPLSRLRKSRVPVAGVSGGKKGPAGVLTVVGVPQLGWMIHYHQPMSEIDRRVRGVTYPILCILALVVLTVPLQAFLFLRTVIRPYAVRPLEQEVQARRAEADALLDAVADGIVVIGTDYKVLRANHRIAGVYGDTVNRHCYEAFFCEEGPCSTCPSRQVFETGRPAQITRSISSPASDGAGEERWLEALATPLFDDKGNIIASIEVIRDVTERRRAEEGLAQSSRLRALGELAAGIAHEIRTPMNGVTVFLESVQTEAQRIDAPEEMQHDLQLIREQADRVIGITERILSFAKEESPKLELLNVNWVIERVLEFVGSGLRAHGIEVNTEYAAAFPLVLAGFNELYEVLLNLITNAQDAMPHGGTLALETTQTEGAVLVRVVDSGVGIPPEQIARVFEPGFSTKSDQGIAKGLGLGLFLTQDIVESFGGSITLESAVDRGTTFTLRFPISEAE